MNGFILFGLWSDVTNTTVKCSMVIGHTISGECMILFSLKVFYWNNNKEKWILNSLKWINVKQNRIFVHIRMQNLKIKRLIVISGIFLCSLSLFRSISKFYFDLIRECVHIACFRIVYIFVGYAKCYWKTIENRRIRFQFRQDQVVEKWSSVRLSNDSKNRTIIENHISTTPNVNLNGLNNENDTKKLLASTGLGSEVNEKSNNVFWFHFIFSIENVT